MNPMRIALIACLAAAGLAGISEAPAAANSRSSGASSSGPRFSGAAPAHRGGFGQSHSGNHRPGSGARWNGGNWDHRSHSHWGWGLGLAFGVPWALGWYDPWYWGPAYYPPYYGYGPVYRSYGYACEQDEDCWRERQSRGEPAPATTEVAPAAPGEEGGPTQRPLHLNYCDSAKAWYPHVRTCPGGWRLVRPDYNPAP
ncbi:MAG TPA: hypothetical protein VFV55_02190 [Usitatibacteraceae bacterium]|nr:hypothetical protein [Usitatibacteraceae bacterium]